MAWAKKIRFSFSEINKMLSFVFFYDLSLESFISENITIFFRWFFLVFCGFAIGSSLDRFIIYYFHVSSKSFRKVLTHFMQCLFYQFSSSTLWSYPRDNLLIPFFTLINTFFTSNNAIFNNITQTHVFRLFNRKKPPKNMYTRKQPTHLTP